MLFLFGLAAGAVVFTALPGIEEAISPPGPQTAQWFSKHLAERDEVVTWCRNNPDDVRKHAFGPQTCDNAFKSAPEQ